MLSGTFIELSALPNTVAASVLTVGVDWEYTAQISASLSYSRHKSF